MMSAQEYYFAVEPITTCEHYQQDELDGFRECWQDNGQQLLKKKCQIDDCDINDENWFCLKCQKLYCSRYKKKHMLDHREEYMDHQVAFSISDGSFWCYQCDSYIDSDQIKSLRRLFSSIKFTNQSSDQSTTNNTNNTNNTNDSNNNNNNNNTNDNNNNNNNDDNINNNDDNNNNGDDDDDKQKDDDQIDGLNKEMDKMNLIDIESICEGIIDGKYKKIAVITGAGISTSCGIPDFRSKGTGLYDNLQKYDLDYPEQIFETNYFRKKPEAFYSFAKEFMKFKDNENVKPSAAHEFIAELEQKGKLLINFTQNIDGLELKAGLDKSKLLQAHGHIESAHCIECDKDFSIESFKECVMKDQILYCNNAKCQPRNPIVKPRIVFFGEALPSDFFKKMMLMQQSDLVFVMGTSLMVSPFNSLLCMIDKSVPTVILNNPIPPHLRNNPNTVMMEADIDTSVKQIRQHLKWNQ